MSDDDIQISARQQLIELNTKKKQDQLKETIKTIDSINNELDESIAQGNNAEHGETSNANLEDSLVPL